MFDLVAGLIAFCVAMSFVSGLLSFIFYIIGFSIGAMATPDVKGNPYLTKASRDSNSTLGGCLGTFIAFIISIYPSYLFALEVVARLNS